jgi:hypothetical protein
MKTNPWVDLVNMLPKNRITIGEVLSVNSIACTSVIRLHGGGDMVVQGKSVAVGKWCFVEGMVIVGEAPTLTTVADQEVA